MSNEELKPCPFCGGAAEMQSDLGKDYWVQCKACDAADSVIHDAPKAARDRWNQRAAPPVAALGASIPAQTGISIDTPEFRNLLAAYARTWGSNSPAANFGLKMVDRELISHIDAHAAQRYEAGFQDGLKHAHQQALTVTHALMAERDAAKASLARLAKWIVQRGRGSPDHACAQCAPYSDILKPGFVCAYHLAEAMGTLLPAKAEAPDDDYKPAIPYDVITHVRCRKGCDCSQREIRLCVASTPAPAMGEELPPETEAFETWAKSKNYDMTTHPLHWLFLDAKTYAARQGWKAALEHGRACMALRQPGAAFNERAAMKCQVNEFSSKVCERGVKGCHISHGNNPYVSAFDQGRATAPVSQPAAQELFAYFRKDAGFVLADAWCGAEPPRDSIALYAKSQPLSAPAGSEQEGGAA